MPKPTLTRELARAAALDVAYASTRAAGRTAWNQDDADVYTREFNRLWPVEYDLDPQSIPTETPTEESTNA